MHEMERRIVGIPSRRKTLTLPRNRESSSLVLASAVNIKAILDPASFIQSAKPNDNKPKTAITITDSGGAKFKATLSTKSVLKAKDTIAQHGIENVTLLVQGKLEPDSTITGAGLVAHATIGKQSHRNREDINSEPT